MKHKTIFLLITGLALVAACTMTFGDDDDDDAKGLLKRTPGVAVVKNKLYQTECGSCHFPYQPGLLPERSWRKLMSGLNDHFGDNAELAPADQQAILTYLTDNSAEKGSHRRSKKIMRSLRDSQTPLRITDVPYIKGKHDEVPARMVAGNKAVGSLSYCDKCHQTVDTGSFSERQIKIPGFGRWED